MGKFYQSRQDRLLDRNERVQQAKGIFPLWKARAVLKVADKFGYDRNEAIACLLEILDEKGLHIHVKGRNFDTR